MGYDSLIQVGKSLGKDRDDNAHITTRIQKNLPVIEKSLDKVGALYTFKMEFYTYTDSPSVSLDIELLPKLISPFYEEG